ncbi:MAG: LysM peptidoglycan-binding domain-containing protein [Thermodesulfovibrionales bacterium]
MLSQRGIYCFILVLLLLPVAAFSQSQEVKEYTVIKGDTLWGISGKELNDNFLWPKVWKENPEITNPDRLYPGQIVRIPLYLLQKEQPEAISAPAEQKQEAPAAETVRAVTVVQPKGPEPVVLKPLVVRSLLVASGYIAENVKGIGMVDGSPTERRLFGSNDIIYIKTNSPARIGERFYIIRPGIQVKHPVTNKPMGSVIEIRGVAEVFQFEYGSTKARIIEMFDDIEIGDLLDTYYEIHPPLTTGAHRKPNISGMVVAAREMRLVNGSFNVVYIDKGQRDGIEVGDVLQTVRLGEHRVPNSTIQVINYKDSTATAIIRSFTDTVTPGDKVVQAK